MEPKRKLKRHELIEGNKVTFTINGLSSGDSVLVAPWDGHSINSSGTPQINQGQLSLSTTLSTNNTTSVQVTSIPTDTPLSGTIRVVDDSGMARRLNYSHYIIDTFIIPSTDEQVDFSTINATINNDVFITYIDTTTRTQSESFIMDSTTDRTLYVVVRNGGHAPIKQFTTTTTLNSTDTSITAIRISDV